MGGSRRPGHLGARAEAGVGEAGPAQAIERRPVAIAPLRLPVGAEGAAEVGPLVPGEPEPAQLLEDADLQAGPDAGWIEVLDAHHQRPPGGPGRQPGQQRGAGVAEVEGAGGARGEAAAVAHQVGAPVGEWR